MRDIVKNPIAYVLDKLNLYFLYTLKKTGPLKEDGWLRSYREKRCIDSDGNPIPWLTYPAIDFLKNRIHAAMSIFEYGCGDSTLWWAVRTKEVISIEHDKDWYDKILRAIPSNVRLSHVALEYGGDYSRMVTQFTNRFDIIVIDGRDRINCAINSIMALKADGVIIWDNSDRLEYKKGYDFLYNNGFRKIEFVGLAPIYNIKQETGIFYRRDNCLGI